MRTLLRRPVIHHVIIVGYILAPVVNIALLLLFTGLPLDLVLRRLFAGYGTLAALWLLTAPIAGIGLYFVHRVSWYVFLAHSALILVDFVSKWVVRPGYYLKTIPRLNNALILLGNLALVGAIAYLINRDFRAPYFQALRRHWRESVRIPMRHDIVFDGDTRAIDDISTGGCFIVGPNNPEGLGKTFGVSFRLGSLDVACRGQVMRVTDNGYGVRFVGLPPSMAHKLRQALHHRFALRYRVDLAASWENGVPLESCRVSNISSGGCYVQTAAGEVAEGSAGVLRIRDERFGATIPGRVAWTNGKGELGKAPGFGVEFRSRHRRLVRRLNQAGFRTLTR